MKIASMLSAVCLLIVLAGCAGTLPADELARVEFGPRPIDFTQLHDALEKERAYYPALTYRLGQPYKAAHRGMFGGWSYGWAIVSEQDRGRYRTTTDASGNVTIRRDIFKRQWFRPLGGEWERTPHNVVRVNP